MGKSRAITGDPGHSRVTLGYHVRTDSVIVAPSGTTTVSDFLIMDIN
jgi:hypothetical protein